MYKEALQRKLRFETPKGSLNVEQLWDLSFKDLKTCVTHAKRKLDENVLDDELSFLEDYRDGDNSTEELSFNILKDVYLTKRREKEALNEVSRNKEHNERIMALIHEKEEQSLKELSPDELRSMLR